MNIFRSPATIGRHVFTALLVVAVAMIAVIGFRGTSDLAHRKFKATLVLKWSYDPGFAGEMVAKRKDFFGDQGLDVTLQPGGFEINPITLVESGASEFGVAGSDSFLIARSRGHKIVAIAAGYIDTAAAYYVHAGSGINGVPAMRGKRVGVQAGQDTETIFDAMLRKAGMKPADVIEVPVKYSSAPFVTGSVDVWPGYVATQSFIFRNEHIPFEMIRPRDVGLSFPGTVYFTSEAFFSQHPDIVKAFVRSVMQGWYYAYSNLTDAGKIIESFDSRNLPFDLVESNLQDQRDQIRPDGYRFGEIRMSDWDALNQTLFDLKLINAKVDISQALKPQT